MSLPVKLSTNQLRHRGGTYALDNIRDFAGPVAAGSGEQLHHGWIYSPVAGIGSNRADLPAYFRKKDGSLNASSLEGERTRY